MAFGFFRTFSPILYQIRTARGNSFERWYFAHTITKSGNGSTPKTTKALSFTPGVVRSGSDSYSFIRVLDGRSDFSQYFRFPIDYFSFRDHPFEIRIGENRFSMTGLDVDLKNSTCRVKASIKYGKLTRPHFSPVSPGGMGPYGLLPSMGCYHAVGSMGHAITGTVEYSDGAGEAITDSVDLAGGRGYIEKNWGKKLPADWLWIQSNTFESVSGSLSFVLSHLTVFGESRKHFVCIFSVDGKEYRFTDFSRASIDLFEYDSNSIRILIRNASYKMELLVRRKKELYLPFREVVYSRREMAENLDASVRVVVKRRRGQCEDIVLDATSNATAVEMAGSPDALRT